MPVEVKKANGWAALEKLGFSKFEIENFNTMEIGCKLTASAFEFSIPGIAKTVAVTLDDLLALKAGKLSELKKALLKKTCQEALDALGMVVAEQEIEKLNGPKPTTQVEIKAQFDAEKMMALNAALKKSFTPLILKEAADMGALDLLPKPVMKITPQPKAKHDQTVPIPSTIMNALWKEFPEGQKKSAPLVQLRKATQMYQPVQGTSAGSRYYVVAANEDLRVAARIQGGTLSVRIEGTGWEKYKSALVSAGFGKVSASKQYASMHLDVGHDSVMASKTLGAVLLGLGIPMQTPLPDLNKIPKG